MELDLSDKPVDPVPYTSQAQLKLGERVIEASTGITGVVNMMAENINGVTQFSIQPEGDGTTIPEAYMFDWFLLSFVDEGLSKRVPAPDKKAKFKVGQKLKDTVTGVEGIAVEKVTYLNGCVSYGIQNVEMNKNTGEAHPVKFFDYKRLELVSEGVKKAETSKSGGPSSRSFATRRARDTY